MGHHPVTLLLSGFCLERQDLEEISYWDHMTKWLANTCVVYNWFSKREVYPGGLRFVHFVTPLSKLLHFLIELFIPYVTVISQFDWSSESVV